MGQEKGIAKKPLNVLFIAVDDLRPDLGCYGNKFVRSPNIDRFAKSALVFTRAYCQQAVCNPSRTSLMTGLRPDTIGVTGNHRHFRSNRPNVVTLPQHFKNHGYHAAAIGKLYHGVFPDGASNTVWDTMGDADSWSEPAVRFGPRYYYTEAGMTAAEATFRKVYKPKNPAPDDWTKKLVFGPATEAPDVSDNTLYDGKVADAAIEKLADLKKRGQPFFLGVGFIKPHSPYIAPEKYFTQYRGVGVAKNQQLPPGAPKFAGHGSGELRRYTDQPSRGPIPEKNQKRVRQAYYACVSYIDAQIGRVLNELEKQGLADNTVVCLYGDHGYHLGEQGLWGKTTNFELDTRVPFLVRKPGMKAAGQTTQSLVELLDLYPTLAEIAGLPIGKHLEGKSAARLLDQPKLKTKNVALSQYPRGGGLMGYSMRTANHRLTQWVHHKSNQIRATELYTYSDDLMEIKNIADEVTSQALLRELRPQFNEAFAGSWKDSNAPSLPQKKIRVACVGDSITFGYGIKNREKNSYPSLLQTMLGSDFEVENFGYSGATLLKKGHKPYWEKPPYPRSLAFEPDIVVINLGANDVIDLNWQHSEDFENDYVTLIETYRNLPSKPKVIICEILPIFSHHIRYQECIANRKQLTPLIRTISKKSKTKLIDLHTPFEEKKAWFPDALHPNASGAKVIAEKVFATLTGKQPPLVEIFVPQPFEAGTDGTSFEKEKSGKFETVKSNVGTWSVSSGVAVIDQQHAKTGKQCLHLHGGSKTEIVLRLAERTKRDIELTFAVERWTKRSPFDFRVSKKVGQKWTEVYNGNNSVKFGSSFLTAVKIELGDTPVTHLRFQVSSPKGTGVLIDDLRVGPRPRKKASSK